MMRKICDEIHHQELPQEKDPFEIDINKMFRNPALRKEPRMIDYLWERVERRTIARYGTLEKAFRQMDSSGDGAVS